MKRQVIAAVLVASIMLAGAYAFAQAPGGPGGWSRPWGPGGPRGEMGMHRPMMRRMISEGLDRALDRASATPEQRVKIYAARDRVFAALDAARPDPKAQRDRMLALFEGDQLTTAQLDGLHQQMEQQRQAVRQAIDQAIVETHDTLSPPQRKVVAEYFRTHGPGGFGGPHGPGGPEGPGGPHGPGGPGPR